MKTDRRSTLTSVHAARWLAQTLAADRMAYDVAAKMLACGHQHMFHHEWCCTHAQHIRYEELCRSEDLMAAGLLVTP